MITGSTGFLGSNIKDLRTNKYFSDTIYTSSKDFNLINLSENIKLLKDVKPTHILHLAAYSGGILANKTYPADFYRLNLQLINNMYFGLVDSKIPIKKLLITIGGCSYPSDGKNPLIEDNIWNGYPQIESAPYSVAKKTALTAKYAYQVQHNLNSQVVIPGNMYGKYDNFSPENSHVIPGIINRMYHNLNQKEFVCWGDGSPIRDFIYAKDVAEILMNLVKKDSNETINISSGKGIKIKTLVNIIKNELAYKGKIIWDTEKPNGQMVKIFSVKKMREQGLVSKIELKDGLKKTIKWFKENITKKKIRV